VIFQQLQLINYRNHAAAAFDFADGVTLIVGPNGAGKTNILEAIHLLATGKSFRAHYDREVVFNPDLGAARDHTYTEPGFARVVGKLADAQGSEILELVIVKASPYTNVSHKTFKVNGTPKPVSQGAKYFASVLFCPQDLELFTGSPALRRKFLDNLLCRLDQKYKSDHALYTKAIRQRNRLLENINKTGRGDAELPFWTTEILRTGTYVQEKRSQLIQTLNNTVGHLYSTLAAQASKVQINYTINRISLERLHQHHAHEIYAKTTLVGPHRDDFDFLLNTYSLSRYGSRGQQRTGVVALKLCELNLTDQTMGSFPILLLDDIFSELDDSHKQALEEVVQKHQTIITSTHSNVNAQQIITL